MEINEVHADTIYEEEREKRAGVDKFTGTERHAPMPPMSPFSPVRTEDDDDDASEDSYSSIGDDYRDRGMSPGDFLS